MKNILFALIAFGSLFGGSVEVFTQGQAYPCLAYIARAYSQNPSIVDSLLVSDFYSQKKIASQKAFFVINSKYTSTCSKYPIFAFEDEVMAKKFIHHYGGAIRDFDFALFVAQKDLTYDLPILKARDEKEIKRGRIIAKEYVEEIPKIDVPKQSRCPVCAMFVAKYPKWVAHVVTKEGHNHYFDGVKDMMKFYFEPQKYHHNYTKEDFSSMFVSDYYTLEKIEAKEAFYVVGSNIYGPMGHEFIPFKSEADAKTFSKTYNGKKIYRFDALTRDIIGEIDR